MSRFKKKNTSNSRDKEERKHKRIQKYRKETDYNIVVGQSIKEAYSLLGVEADDEKIREKAYQIMENILKVRSSNTALKLYHKYNKDK